MKTINATGLKWLKTLHVLCAVVWIGCAFCMNVMKWFIDPDGDDQMYMLALAILVTDNLLIYVGVFGCLLTGLIYGLWTKWGFFKHKWIAAKWMLALVMILIGTFVIGPAVKGNVHELSGYVDNPQQYYDNAAVSSLWGLIQICLLLIAVFISVFKPWKNKKR